tara:strand:- start:673 stop:786 length:114 start_codon:yes stop_codon:yes gene_type:complete
MGGRVGRDIDIAAEGEPAVHLVLASLVVAAVLFALVL